MRSTARQYECRNSSSKSGGQAAGTIRSDDEIGGRERLLTNEPQDLPRRPSALQTTNRVSDRLNDGLHAKIADEVREIAEDGPTMPAARQAP